MKRLLILLLMPVLLGAGPSGKIELEPAVPRLGEPVTVSILLPEGDWSLTDYPDFTPFRILDRPRYLDDRLQLRLLPLNFGEATIPELSLYQGSNVWRSEALAVTIIDPFASVETIAPRLLLPENNDSPLPRALFLTVILLALMIGGYLLRRQPQIQQSSLEALAGRLSEQPESGLRAELSERLNSWRFGPYQPTRNEIVELEMALERLERGQ